MWGPIIELDECGSTNDELKRRANAGAAAGTVVIADAQTRGRGRLDRSWESPAGLNLYMSCLLRPTIPAMKVAPITLAAGIAVAETAREWGALAQLKWPNDVLVGDHKLAGVLTEMSGGERVDYVIIGIGVNLNQVEFSPRLAGAATSMQLATGAVVDRGQFRQRLLANLQQWIEVFLANGVAGVAERWTDLARLGSVSVTIKGEDVRGQALGLSSDGALEVLDEHGGHHRIHSGDVTFAGVTA